MESFVQIYVLSTSTDKCLDFLHFFAAASLESTGIVENELSVALENDFMFDVVQTTSLSWFQD
jgi:hypothetical protein